MGAHMSYWRVYWAENSNGHVLSPLAPFRPSLVGTEIGDLIPMTNSDDDMNSQMEGGLKKDPGPWGG